MIKKVDINEVERAMPEGVPAKLRALTANGDSISPPVSVLNEMLSFAKTSYGVSEEKGYTIIAKFSYVMVGGFVFSSGSQGGNSNKYMGIVFVTVSKTYPFFSRTSLAVGLQEPTLYYKLDGNDILIAVQDQTTWSHISVTSFHPGITPMFQKISSIQEWNIIT